MNFKCRFCEHSRPLSELIGHCAMQSVNNANADLCDDFRKRKGVKYAEKADVDLAVSEDT